MVNYQFVVANEIDEGLGNIRKCGFACHHGVVDSDDFCNHLRNWVLGVQQVVELPSGQLAVQHFYCGDFHNAAFSR